jgi:multiple sugar transport system permease protein
MTTIQSSPPERKPLFAASMAVREARLAWALILPCLVLVLGLVLFPAFFSIWISFHQVGLVNLGDVFHAPWVGLQNYSLVFNDFAFKFRDLLNWGAALTTVVYSVLSTILVLALGLIAALILNRRFLGRGVARGIFLFPYIAPVVSVAFVWRWLLDPRPSGVFNHVLTSIGLLDAPQAFLATRGLAIWLVILFQGWRYFPFAMLMLLARLQAIDETLYEAAGVDGASTWQKFLFITLPELRYVMGAIFLLRLLWTFNKFDDIWLLTGGGYGTNVLPVLTYQFSFGSFNFGKGAATAMIQLVALVILLVIYALTVMRSDEA